MAADDLARDALLGDLADAVVDYDADDAVALARMGIAQGIPVGDIVANGLAAGLGEVVDAYERRERYLVDLFNAGRVMDAALAVLAPDIERARAEGPPARTVVVGLLAPNVQDLGKNIVALLLRGRGLDVVDLGSSVQPERFVAAVEERAPDAVSVTVMTNEAIPGLARLVGALRAAGLLEGRLVMCGGAAASADVAASLGIRYGETAGEAVAMVREHVRQTTAVWAPFDTTCGP